MDERLTLRVYTMSIHGTESNKYVLLMLNETDICACLEN